MKQEECLTTWNVLIRPITKYAAPLWHTSLLECDKRRFENLQKKGLGLIFGTIYIDYRRYYKINGQPVSYEHALKLCDLTFHAVRRENLTTKFALDMYKNPMHKDLFKRLPDSRPNTRTKPKVYVPSGSTERYNKSAIPTFTRIINSKSSWNKNVYVHIYIF